MIEEHVSTVDQVITGFADKIAGAGHGAIPEQ
jgi:hypothetical protein